MTIEDCRRRLCREDLSDREIETFLIELDVFIDLVLDEMFHEEFESDDV